MTEADSVTQISDPEQMYKLWLQLLLKMLLKVIADLRSGDRAFLKQQPFSHILYYSKIQIFCY